MGNDEFDIDPDELSTHRRRLGDVIDRIRTAHDAADDPLDKEAFGAFGIFLATDCAQSQRDGADAIGIVLDAANEHQQKVGAWVADLDTRELDIAGMFSTAPEARGA
jgi:hypothetical protein